MRTLPAVLALSLTTVLAVPGGASAATTPEPALLVDGRTTSAQLSVPFPGHSTTFDLVAHATTGAPADVALLVDGGSGPLADGAQALQLELTDEAGEVLAAGTATELAAAPIALGTLGADPLTLRGTASLPATAGDEMQGVGMSLQFTLVASDATPAAGPAGLALTGAQPLVVAVLAAVLAAVGALVLAARRRRGREDA